MNENTVKIYVNLLEEGSPAARPTQAEMLGNNTYRVLPTHNYDRADEVWQFPPGSVVHCEKKIYEGKEYLLAVKKVEG